MVGNSIVSSQQVGRYNPLLSESYLLQVFLGTPNKVYILDKVENNPGQIDGRPVWGEGLSLTISIKRLRLPLPEWTLSNDQQRAMNVISNTFCAVRTLSCSNYHLQYLREGTSWVTELG